MTDGFGRRVSAIDAATGDPVEHLEVAPGLVAHNAFTAALAERVTRLADVRHASYVHIRRLDRPATDQLVVVSDHTPGSRLSDLLERSGNASGRPDIRAVVALVRQLLPAVALFSRHNRAGAIGTLAPERLFVVAPGRVVIADAMLGAAVDQLQLNRIDAWRRYGVTSPPNEDFVTISQRTDAVALGVVTLSMLLGRLLADKEFPGGLNGLLSSIRERHDDEERPLSPAFAKWLQRTLQLDEDEPFDTPQAAQIGFEEVLASEKRYLTAPKALEEFIAKYGEKPAPAPAVKTGKSRLGDVPRPGAARVEPVGKERAVKGDLTLQTSDLREPIAPVRSQPEGWTWLPKVAAGLVALVVVEAMVIGWLWTRPAAGLGSGDGELVIQSRPPGARVTIDGEERGQTPLTLSISSGSHVMEVRAGGTEPRVIPLTIRAGVQTAQYVELDDAGTKPGTKRSGPAAKSSSSR